jgi:iron complex outermembrane receptor protein
MASRTRAGILALGVSLVALAGAARAQNEDTSSSIQTKRTAVGEIVVTAAHYVPQGEQTATKTNIPLIQTPESISVVTRDQIDLLDFVDAQQAVRYTAGVFGENYGPDLRYDFINVRGFTPKQYIDGLAAPATTTIFSNGVDLYAFQSLDLLKGPASTLYGNAPPGGIYNETSRRASSRFGGELQGRYGSNDFAEIAGTVTGPLTDFLDARFTALYRDRGDEVDHINAKRLLVAPTATLKLGPDTRLTVLMYYQYDEVNGGDGGFLPVYGTLLPNPNGMIPRNVNLDDPRDKFIRNQGAIGWDFEHQFSPNITFHSNVKWSEYLEKTPIGYYSGAGLINTTDPTMPSYFRTVEQYNFTYREHVGSFAADNRFDVNFDTGPLSHKALIGVDYRQVYNSAEFGFAFPGTLLDAFNPVYAPTIVTNLGYPTPYNFERLRQTGIYGQDQLKFGHLYVTGGARYDWVNIADRSTNTDTGQRQFTYRVGASYVTDSGIAPYISYATSFEPVLGTDAVTGAPFKPSKGDQIEGGVKFDARSLPPGIKLFATAAVFDIHQSNVVSTVPSITPVFGTQVGKVQVYGVELEFVARFYDRLSINGSYSYNHSRVTASSVPAEVGSPLPTTPQNKASLFADYTLSSGALAGLGFGAGVRYTDGSTGGLPGPFNPVIYEGQASTLFDAILHYDLPGWRFAINGSNIFDKTYVARCAGPASCFYGAGRQITGTITKRF